MNMLVLTTLALLAAPDDKQLEPFQGKWKIVSVLINGDEPPNKEDLEKSTLTVKGDERILRLGDELKTRSKYKIDPTKSPKTIDITVIEGDENLKGRTLKGVYDIQGDTMTVVLSLTNERPTDLTCKPESNRVLQKFQRTKAK